jgi:ribonuclease Z
MILKSYSAGLCSTWHFWRPGRCLFDCGEGVASLLRHEIYAVENIFITHGHFDHYAGLPMFIAFKLSSKGDNDKPLNIYYPKGTKGVEQMRDMIRSNLGKRLDEWLKWVAIDDNTVITLNGKKFWAESYQTKHLRYGLSLGYHIVEARTKLKPEYLDLSGSELRAIPDSEKLYKVRYKVLSYTGDSEVLDPSVYKNTVVLVHECTFIDKNDMTKGGHSAIEDVVDLAGKIDGLKGLVLFHFSPRYNWNKVDNTVAKKTAVLAGSGVTVRHVPPNSRVHVMDDVFPGALKKS